MQKDDAIFCCSDIAFALFHLSVHGVLALPICIRNERCYINRIVRYYITTYLFASRAKELPVIDVSSIHALTVYFPISGRGQS